MRAKGPFQGASLRRWTKPHRLDKKVARASPATSLQGWVVQTFNASVRCEKPHQFGVASLEVFPFQQCDLGRRRRQRITRRWKKMSSTTILPKLRNVLHHARRTWTTSFEHGPEIMYTSICIHTCMHACMHVHTWHVYVCVFLCDFV